MIVNLTEELRAEAAAYAANLNAAIEANAYRIKQAEELARRLSSCGVGAQPFARLDRETVLVWVTATIKSTDQLEAALTKLDLQEAGSAPGQHPYEIRLSGHDIPLYVYTPTVEAHLLSQIGITHDNEPAHA